MAQLNITLNQEEILLLLSIDGVYILKKKKKTLLKLL